MAPMLAGQGAIGYHIGTENREGEELTFYASGCLNTLLERRMASPDSFTHIILDEVNEGELDAGSLSHLVRQVVRRCARDVKVLVMSVTPQPVLPQYFRPLQRRMAGPGPFTHEAVPVLEIAERRFLPAFLEDYLMPAEGDVEDDVG